MGWRVVKIRYIRWRSTLITNACRLRWSLWLALQAYQTYIWFVSKQKDKVWIVCIKNIVSVTSGLKLCQ